MKYSNSLKYMNSFSPAEISREDISQKRAAMLCESLGRINLGMRCICLPCCGAGHTSALMLESVMVCAGHNVGRITSAYNFDSRSSVLINGEIPAIEDYNGAVEELKSALKRNPDVPFTREETTFVLGLLLCKMNGCEYVILEGLSGVDFSLDAVCAPYDLIVTPTFYGCESDADRLKCLCDTIRRGTREVVSGNQRSEIYNTISNACAISGARLNIPVKAQLEVEVVSSRSLSFSYVGRDGFTLKNPSYIARDCAITVIEAALALRRGGVRIPWNSITAGLSAATASGCFDMLSLSPKLILDASTGAEEASMLKRTACELWGENVFGGVTLCISDSALDVVNAFGENEVASLMVCVSGDNDIPGGAVAFASLKKAAREICDVMRSGRDVVCFGDVGFISSLKCELLKLMNG